MIFKSSSGIASTWGWSQNADKLISKHILVSLNRDPLTSIVPNKSARCMFLSSIRNKFLHYLRPIYLSHIRITCALLKIAFFKIKKYRKLISPVRYFFIWNLSTENFYGKRYFLVWKLNTVLRYFLVLKLNTVLRKKKFENRLFIVVPSETRTATVSVPFPALLPPELLTYRG